MKREDLEKPELAEFMFYYVGLPDIFEDFCTCSELADLSIAEYIAKYRFEDFRKWYEDLRRG